MSERQRQIIALVHELESLSAVAQMCSDDELAEAIAEAGIDDGDDN